MNFKHSKNLQESIDGMKKIFSISWSPNLMRLAVAHVDEKRSVRITLYDENGEKREHFPTRAANKNNKSYVVRDISFSPDSTKLAVSQSDSIIFVYNLGSNWGDKKVICNKFEQNAQITSMVWPMNRAYDLYFGIADGKVKMGMLKSNSAQVLYSTESYVITLATSIDGKFIISGHMDMSIYKYSIDAGSLMKITTCVTIPYCISSGIDNQIFLAGSDSMVYVLNENGEHLQTFDYTEDAKVKDFTLSRQNSSNDLIAIGNYNRLFIFGYNYKKNQWEESNILDIENYYTVTALCWKPDLNMIVVGSLCGSLDMFESYNKKTIINDKFEITYLSNSQVICKDIESGTRLNLKSLLSNEIVKLDVHVNNFLVISTTCSLIIAEISTGKSSEVNYEANGNEKFDFNNMNLCLIYNSGEVAVVEIGLNEILGHCRTEYVHPNLVSAKVYSNKTKVIAYLVDPYTIYIQDLVTTNLLLNYTHDAIVEFIDFNRNGTKLIFRDSKKHLNLFSICEKKKVTLVSFCSFVQWVPGTDVLVAQEGKSIVVWYNIDDSENMSMIQINGEIEEVRRTPEGITEVVIDESGPNSNGVMELKSYSLDNTLIELAVAIEEKDLNQAVKILETKKIEHDINTYWKSIANIALEIRNLPVAQRCFAALGSYAKSSYIKKILKDITLYGSIDHPLVEAKLLILDKQFSNAEDVMLKNNLVNEAIEIFNEIHRYEEGLRIAEKFNLPESLEMRQKYFKWLIDNEMFDKAAEYKLLENKPIEAIKLYIKGDLQMKAVNIILKERLNIDRNIIEYLINSMVTLELYNKAAELYEYIGNNEESISMWIKGNSYDRALESARKGNKPNETLKQIEEQWGDYLQSQRLIEQSVSHFIDADRLDKAIESLIQCRNWEKAEVLLMKQNLNESKYTKCVQTMSDHFLKEKNYDKLEKLYLLSSRYVDLIQLYINTKQWAKLDYFKDENTKLFYSRDFKEKVSQLAQDYQKSSRFNEAEKAYLLIQDLDSAITMYRNVRHYEEMIRLVETNYPEYMEQTLLIIGNICENEDKQFKLAEKFYLEANCWRKAAEMYYKLNMYEECLNLSDKFLKDNPTEMVKICVQLFQDNHHLAKEKLLSLNMSQHLIRYLCHIKIFQDAIEICNKDQSLLPYVYLSYATELKLQKKLNEAEENYFLANKPKEAIDMYMEVKDFNNALRVGRTFLPDLIDEIYFTQGNYFIQMKEYEKAEIAMTKAKKFKEMYEVYLDKGLTDKAISFAQAYAPDLIVCNNRDIYKAVQLEYLPMIEQSFLYETKGLYRQAVEYYLRIPAYVITQPNVFYSRIFELTKFLPNEEKKEAIIKIINRYMDLDQYDKAADLYKYLSQYEDAVNCLIQGKQYDKAQKFISEIQNLTEREYLSNYYRQKVNPSHLNLTENLFKQGKYLECLQSLDIHDQESFLNYLTKVAEVYFSTNQYLEFTATLLKLDYKFDMNTVHILKKISFEILAEENIEELESLKMLFDKQKDFIFTDTNLIRLKQIVHYQILKFTIKEYENKFPSLYYNLSITALRNGDIIKMDMAFLDAFRISNKLKHYGSAFVFANRYIDFYENIEFGGVLERMSEFDDTEIPIGTPYLSPKNILTPTEKEDLIRWILAKSSDQTIDKALIRVPCVKCGELCFEGNLACPKCKYKYEECIISGFPIRGESMGCPSCKKRAISSHWKDWINLFKYCPWCRSIFHK